MMHEIRLLTNTAWNDFDEIPLQDTKNLVQLPTQRSNVGNAQGHQFRVAAREFSKENIIDNRRLAK